MVLGHLGHHLPEERGEEPGEDPDEAGLLADVHDAEPESEDAGQEEGDLERRLGAFEGGRHHLREDVGLAPDQAPQGEREGRDEEGEPDQVQDIDADLRFLHFACSTKRIRSSYIMSSKSFSSSGFRFPFVFSRSISRISISCWASPMSLARSPVCGSSTSPR